MKRLILFILTLGLFACETEAPAEVSTEKESDQTQKVIKMADVIDGPHTYNARFLDSLSYTYNTGKVNLKNGLYYLTKTSTATINLLPLELWEYVVTRNENFYHPAKPKDTWCLIHRIDKVQFTTAARPVTVETEGEKYMLTIPFDGTSSGKVKNLIEIRGVGKYGLVVDDQVTCIFDNAEGIQTDGIHYSTVKKEEVEFLQHAFNKAP
ncbi:MAG: hypothetical protein ACI80P_001753 [Flavobacteriales bacterium]|jgi:hypothetical protein